uniref:Small ribosomal subunit protein uS15c n=1 Tax=Papaver rhoeas TaxID=33128 RepID=A0A2S1CFD9_PAPRH|nr:ribosomal protein S15 [Papaver rhoeas]AWD30638.1 ribosomal protein S15 [Papaver rhoeas]UTA98150.1 ribosomal protein S15 [Papaver rhoeas]
MIKKCIHLSYFARRKRIKQKGSVSFEFQVLSFTNKMRRLTFHFEFHKKDFLSQRGIGIGKTLGKRQWLLAYL